MTPSARKLYPRKTGKEIEAYVTLPPNNRFAYRSYPLIWEPVFIKNVTSLKAIKKNVRSLADGALEYGGGHLRLGSRRREPCHLVGHDLRTAIGLRHGLFRRQLSLVSISRRTSW